MALLFQSNPDQWNLRQYLKPGGRELWFVNRYLSYMEAGTLTLLWEAQGGQQKAVKGLYGWGIIEAEPARDVRGRLRVPLIYIERWVSAYDVRNKVKEPQHRAAISADDILKLESWRDHLLARMPVGGNFLIKANQLKELIGIVMGKYPASAFGRAAGLDMEGTQLTIDQFETTVIEEEVGDG